MKKYFVALTVFAIAASSFFLFPKEQVSQFAESCVEFNGKESCGIEYVSFNGKTVPSINPEYYSDRTAFWIFDTVNSFDCSRIKKAIEQTVEDKPLKDFFELKLEVCELEVESGKRQEKISFNTDLYDESDWYKDFFPEGTVFESPREYA